MKKAICILSSAIIGLSAVPLSYTSALAEDTVIVSEATENIDWLPITMNDYEAFIAKYGVVSVHDKYIVYCDAVNYSTGDSVIMEQAGTAEIKKVKEYSITTDEPLPPGSKSYVVYVYEAVSAGTVEITISQSRTWDSNAPKDIKSTGFYKVDNDMTITVTDKLDIDNYKKGDVNMDGAFNVSDVVLLQKWLLAVPDVTLPNWKSADLCEDGTLNVFDLCMMKKELLRKADVKTEIEFISTDKLRDYGLDHEEWKGFIAFSNNDFEAIIKNNEGEYTQSILPEDVFNENAVLVVYSQIGASNKYSIIDDISISDNTIVVSSTTKEPTIATPDMSYRRYIYIVNKNAVSKECVFSFNDSSSYFDYEEGNEVANWFKEWENHKN